MTPNSTYELIEIVVGTDYSPAPIVAYHEDPNTGPSSPPGPQVDGGYTSPVFAIFCTQTNTGITKIKALGNDTSIDFPIGSFKQGVVYYIYLKEVEDAGGASFVGYKYKQNPFIL